jgi:hypothetical protein
MQIVFFFAVPAGILQSCAACRLHTLEDFLNLIFLSQRYLQQLVIVQDPRYKSVRETGAFLGGCEHVDRGPYRSAARLFPKV